MIGAADLERGIDIALLTAAKRNPRLLKRLKARIDNLQVVTAHRHRSKCVITLAIGDGVTEIPGIGIAELDLYIGHYRPG